MRLALLAALVVVACGGKTDSAPNTDSCDETSGLHVDVGATMLALHSVTAQVGSRGLVIAFSERRDACDDILSSRDPALLVLTASVPTTSPVTLRIRSEADLKVGPSCRDAGVEQGATAGTLSITTLRPGQRITGSLDTILDSGAHIAVSFDTCFCTRDAPCSTSL